MNNVGQKRRMVVRENLILIQFSKGFSYLANRIFIFPHIANVSEAANTVVIIPIKLLQTASNSNLRFACFERVCVRRCFRVHISRGRLCGSAGAVAVSCRGVTGHKQAEAKEQGQKIFQVFHNNILLFVNSYISPRQYHQLLKPLTYRP